MIFFLLGWLLVVVAVFTSSRWFFPTKKAYLKWRYGERFLILSRSKYEDVISDFSSGNWQEYAELNRMEVVIAPYIYEYNGPSTKQGYDERGFIFPTEEAKMMFLLKH